MKFRTESRGLRTEYMPGPLQAACVADLNPEVLLPVSEDRGQRTEKAGVALATPALSSVNRSLVFCTVLLGGHSELDPRLPIPNRTVKRLCADDSADCPRESRSPPGAHK